MSNEPQQCKWCTAPVWPGEDICAEHRVSHAEHSHLPGESAEAREARIAKLRDDARAPRKPTVLSLREVMYQTLVSLDPQAEGGYSSAADHQLEYLDCVLDQDGVVHITGRHYYEAGPFKREPIGNLQHTYYGREAEVLPALTAAVQAALQPPADLTPRQASIFTLLCKRTPSFKVKDEPVIFAELPDAAQQALRLFWAGKVASRIPAQQHWLDRAWDTHRGREHAARRASVVTSTDAEYEAMKTRAEKAEARVVYLEGQMAAQHEEEVRLNLALEHQGDERDALEALLDDYQRRHPATHTQVFLVARAGNGMYLGFDARNHRYDIANFFDKSIIRYDDTPEQRACLERDIANICELCALERRYFTVFTATITLKEQQQP